MNADHKTKERLKVLPPPTYPPPLPAKGRSMQVLRCLSTQKKKGVQTLAVYLLWCVVTNAR